LLEFTFYETKWLCWQDLWHGADACYGREAKKKKIKFSEEVTKISIKASLRAVVCHEQAIVFGLKCVGDHTYSCDRCVK
jgi:hypothetical protein